MFSKQSFFWKIYFTCLKKSFNPNIFKMIELGERGPSSFVKIWLRQKSTKDETWMTAKKSYKYDNQVQFEFLF